MLEVTDNLALLGKDACLTIISWNLQLAVTSSIMIPFLPWLYYAELGKQIRVLYCNNQDHNARGGPKPKSWHPKPNPETRSQIPKPKSFGVGTTLSQISFSRNSSPCILVQLVLLYKIGYASMYENLAFCCSDPQLFFWLSRCEPRLSVKTDRKIIVVIFSLFPWRTSSNQKLTRLGKFKQRK